jgi:hypothetical protein
VSGWEDEGAEQAFEEALERRLGERIRKDDEFTKRAYGSMTNVTWVHPLHGEHGMSFREAGRILASIHRSGGYVDWYCSSPEGVVDREFKEAMADEMWKPADR